MDRKMEKQHLEEIEDNAIEEGKQKIEKIMEQDLPEPLNEILEWKNEKYENPILATHYSLVFLYGYTKDCSLYGEDIGMKIHEMLDANLEFGSNGDELYIAEKLPILLESIGSGLEQNEHNLGPAEANS